MKAPSILWLGVATSLTACLSIDVVPRGEPDAGDPAPSPDDGGRPDDTSVDPGVPPDLADGEVPDGDTPDVFVPPIPPGREGGTCTAVGFPSYATGPALRCDDGLTCHEGVCITPPLCDVGVSGPCGIDIPTPDDRFGNWVGSADALYWIDLGALDARGNYDRKGAIMRLRFADWSVEAVASDLSFFDESTRTFENEPLLYKDGHLLWVSGGVTYTLRADTPGAAPVALRDYASSWCFVGDVGYRISTRRAFRRDVLSGVDSPERLIASGDELAGTPCFADTRSLVGVKGISLALADDGSASLRDDMLGGNVVFADDRQVLHLLPDGYIGRRVRGEDGVLGPVRSVGGPTYRALGVVDGSVYWFDRQTSCWILGAPLDGSADPRVVAWTPDCSGSWTEHAGEALLNNYAAQSLGFDFLYVPYSEVSP